MARGQLDSLRVPFLEERTNRREQPHVCLGGVLRETGDERLMLVTTRHSQAASTHVRHGSDGLTVLESIGALAMSLTVM